MALTQVDNAEYFCPFPCYRAADFQFSFKFFIHATSTSGEQDVKAYLYSGGGEAWGVSAEVTGNQFYLKSDDRVKVRALLLAHLLTRDVNLFYCN